ncbi:MAG: hypothetical protein KME17_27965 [Cyanosarcina radialis HA8281-LM2]|jgi:hypothetical protein|nr:hypothetical protein [Cyanosarcina radialis HA8281-LM2]
MANQVWKAGNHNAQTYTAKNLVANFNKSNTHLEKLSQWIDLITDKFSRIYRRERFDPDLIRAIFWTLSESHVLYAIKWLSGKELSENKSHELSLPNLSADLRNSEAKAFDHIQQILSLVSLYKPLIICFDELDLPDKSRSQTGLAKPHIVASLIKTLVDSINLPTTTCHGVVILTVMMPDTWTQKIKQMPGGVPDRVSAKKEPINLDFMDGDAIVELVKLWLAEFYQQNNLNPPTEIYPFEESFLRELGDGNSVREILKACADKFAPYVTPKEHPVEFAYNKELSLLESSRQLWLDDKYQLANAIQESFKTLIGKQIDKFKIEGIEPIKPENKNKVGGENCFDFKIIGNQDSKIIKIGVAVFQKTHWQSVKAVLKRIVNYQTFDITYGCLVRSRKITNSPVEAKQNLEKFLSAGCGGKWVLLSAEDIKPLLAIWFVYSGREDYQVTLEEIIDFIHNRKLVIDNSLIHAILSEPTGKIPEGLTDD